MHAKRAGREEEAKRGMNRGGRRWRGEGEMKTEREHGELSRKKAKRVKSVQPLKWERQGKEKAKEPDKFKKKKILLVQVPGDTVNQ